MDENETGLGGETTGPEFFSIPKFFLVNTNNGLVGGHDYGSMEAAVEAIKTSNIPIQDVKAIALPLIYLNEIHQSKYGGKN